MWRARCGVHVCICICCVVPVGHNVIGVIGVSNSFRCFLACTHSTRATAVLGLSCPFLCARVSHGQQLFMKNRGSDARQGVLHRTFCGVPDGDSAPPDGATLVATGRQELGDRDRRERDLRAHPKCSYSAPGRGCGRCTVDAQGLQETKERQASQMRPRVGPLGEEAAPSHPQRSQLPILLQQDLCDRRVSLISLSSQCVRTFD